MITVNDETKKQLLKEYNENKVYLEGNIIRIIDGEDDKEFIDYLETCLENDKNNRKKRLEITKQIQTQNKELIDWRDENQKLTNELQDALESSKRAKDVVQYDLDVLQKKTQFELIGSIVKIALWIIVGVGISTTLLYFSVLMSGKENKILESTWSNLFGILLTNSFSIIGTIMGIKYGNNTKS